MTIEPALNRLKSALRRARGVEATVHWAKAGEWSEAHDEPLEHEEIIYYAEGLLLDGFDMAWQLLGDDARPENLRLFFWQEGTAPPLPAPPAALKVLDQSA